MLYDLTPTVSPELKVWPTDTPPRREVLFDLRRGDTITLSTLHATVHLGAHADAPSHYGIDAPTIDACPLTTYLGPCQVVRANVQPGETIEAHHLPDQFQAPRVLVATGTYPDPTCFNEDFAAFDPSAIEKLATEGTLLVGIDTPSVDPFDAEDLLAHQACLHHGIAILEGLRLDHVPEGIYELIALPLKLKGYDASPVRAVLRDLRS